MPDITSAAQSFAKDRTESDICEQKPIAVKLGKKGFDIVPLAIKPGKDWRGEVSKVLNTLAAGSFANQLSSAGFMQGLMVAFFQFPDEVLRLLMLYSPALKEEEDWLMDHATDEEVVIAFSRVMAVAYPYFSLLSSLMTVSAQQ